VVPRRALVGNYLYVVKNGRVEIRKVKVGYTWLTGAEVIEGVEVGEDLVLENQDTLHDGERVRIERVPTAPPAKSS
jgi:hypothetical protein